MDYEKAYKEALERARGNHGVAINYGKTEEIQELEHIFPELAESEDERIRKGLVALVEQSSSILEPKNQKRMLTYLEKQTEQEPEKYSLKQAAEIFLDALSETTYNNKPITDAQVITRELLNFLSNAYSYNPDALYEQNPAEWSEENESILNRLLDVLHNHVGHLWNYDFDSWLKSLRPQPRWKPSEEQIAALQLAADKHWEPDGFDPLYTLLQDLKKLM